MSYEYLAAPVAFAKPSTRSCCLPISDVVPRAGQLYFALATRASFHHFESGLDYVGVSAATAEVAVEACANFLLGRLRVFVQESPDRNHKAWRAETALHAVVVNEGSRDRVWLGAP